MNGRAETCHCGHDKSSHYVDRTSQPPEVVTCLVVGGCYCKKYVHRDDTAPKLTGVKPRKPSHASWCQCYDCRKYDEWYAEVNGT